MKPKKELSMNRFVQCYTTALNKDCGFSGSILFIRLVIGVAMMLHGFGKIQSPMSWMGPEAPIPGFFQLLAALSEFGGGLAWILGLLTPVASFGMMCTMLVATLTHMSQGHPFVGMPSSYELALVYFAFSWVLLLSGPGKFSLDYLIFKTKTSR